MTAYLKPGDKIHLAFPVDRKGSMEENRKASQELADHFTSLYRGMGVEVAAWTASLNPTMTYPVVVAVFRKE